MQIDWLTVGAQIVNFLVLVWLLKRFLYRPVIEAMDKREARIASRLIEAQKREDEAQAEARAYREKMHTLDRERESQLAAARESAERERRNLVESARADIKASRERWQQELEREKEDFRDALVRELAESAIDLARRVLADLAATKLEGEAMAVLHERLKTLPEDERRALAAAPQLRLATAVEADETALESARNSITSALGTHADVEWVHKPELLFGAELSGGGYKVAWSGSGYLRELADRVRETLGRRQVPLREVA